MSTIHLHQTTSSTPEQFVAGLTDFGRRIFGSLGASGPGDVPEGSR